MNYNQIFCKYLIWIFVFVELPITNEAPPRSNLLTKLTLMLAKASDVTPEGKLLGFYGNPAIMWTTT